MRRQSSARIGITGIVAAMLPTIALAGEAVPVATGYTLLAPLGSFLGGPVTLTEYLNGILRVTIAVAGVLAVVMIVICGIKLIGSPSESGKSEAKECITNAILGVLLAIGSWLLLNTINPALLQNELPMANILAEAPQLGDAKTYVEGDPKTPGTFFYKYEEVDSTGKPTGNIRNSPEMGSAEMCNDAVREAQRAGIKVVPPASGQSTCIEVRKDTATGAPTTDVTSSTYQTSDEKTTREQICGNATCINESSTGVFINKQSCTAAQMKEKRPACTNVSGLPSDVASIVKALSSACNCRVTISGGTEPGHASHAVGQPIFDIRRDTAVTKFLRTNGTGVRTSFVRYRVYWNGWWWTDEDAAHWHVCKADAVDSWYCKDCRDKSCKVQVPETQNVMALPNY
jgi:hypothetical protein